MSLVDAAGQVLNSYQYDVFGNTTNYAEKVANRFMYAGEQFDKITGQHYLRARYYNPVVGRFTQEDTYRGDGLNLYAYVANNPLKYVDPSGHCKDGSGYDNTYIEELRLINELSGSAKTAAQRAKVAFDRWYDSARGTDEDRSGVIQFQNDLLRLSNQGINVSRMSTSDLKKLYAASLRWSGEYWTGITTLAMSLLGQAGSAANVVDDVAEGAGNTVKGIIQQFDDDIIKPEHIFSKDHIKNGIMELGESTDDILNSFKDIINSADAKGMLKEGMNQIKTQINGLNAEIKVFIKNGKVMSMDGFRGHSTRVMGNSILWP